MAMTNAPYQSTYFGFEVDGVTIAYFTQLSGLSMDIEVAEQAEGNGKHLWMNKQPGTPKFGDVTLKRGFGKSHDVYNWFEPIAKSSGDFTPVTAGVVVYDRLMKEKMRFALHECWPSSLKVSDLNSSGKDVMVEELTLKHNMLDWVK